MFVVYTVGKKGLYLGRVGETNIIDRHVLFNGRKKGVFIYCRPTHQKCDTFIHSAYSSNINSGSISTFALKPARTNLIILWRPVIQHTVIAGLISQSPLSFSMTLCLSPQNLAAFLPHSHDCSCYVSRPILAPPPLWRHKHTALSVHSFAHSPDLWR